MAIIYPSPPTAQQINKRVGIDAPLIIWKIQVNGTNTLRSHPYMRKKTTEPRLHENIHPVWLQMPSAGDAIGSLRVDDVKSALYFPRRSLFSRQMLGGGYVSSPPSFSPPRYHYLYIEILSVDVAKAKHLLLSCLIQHVSYGTSHSTEDAQYDKQAKSGAPWPYPARNKEKNSICILSNACVVKKNT